MAKTTTQEERAEVDALVAAAKKGDQRAFAALFEKFRPRIYALALHLTGRPSDAEDITQDAFLKAYSRLHTFEGRSAFFTWLYRIALHRALNVRRNQQKRPPTGLDDPRVAAAIAVDAPGNPQGAFELQERYAKLLGAFDELSPLLRTTVVLTTLQGLSYKEAAVVLETTEGTVAWRVHEARRQLRESIERQEKKRPCPKLRARVRRISDEHELSVDGFLGALLQSARVT